MTLRPMLRAEAPRPAGLDAPALARLRRLAREEDAGAPISASVAVLAARGLFDAPPDARTLARVAGANLSAARLLEGHANALRLVELYGLPARRARVRALVAEGARLGVWGVDGHEPLRVAADRLSGGKIFASGLGTVTHAVVSVGGGAATRLALVAAGDPERQDAARWDMPGMRATRSGAYDFTGVALADGDWLGGPGDYFIEPHFVGGVWRIAALQAGATLGLLDAAAEALGAAGRMGAEAQAARLGTALARALAGLALATPAPDDADPEAAVARAIAARLETEAAGLAAIAAVEQSLGLQHFAPGSETHRMARDLAVYMRQAARDALLLRMSARAFGEGRSAWDLVP